VGGLAVGRYFTPHDVPFGDLVFYCESNLLVPLDGGASRFAVVSVGPGTRFHFHEATGRDIEEYAAEHLFRPLGIEQYHERRYSDAKIRGTKPWWASPMSLSWRTDSPPTKTASLTDRCGR
jgi:hypothetical protein